MPESHIKIDDQELTVPAGTTVLEATEQAGIKLPKLCAHPALTSIGACRICLVEVEKQRVLQPACTFPVSEGMVVHTNSPKVVEARRFVLQLLFSERNHFCMFCEMSGNCELQSLAYEYGLDHWEYDRAFPKLGVDATREHFVMDHDRCILCRRCVRACDSLVGNQTLGTRDRGAETMIVADMDVPFGESSCISCGTCLQVCPTGALFDRASAYMGATKDLTRVKSRCNACSVGCGVEWVTRQNRLVRIEGDWDALPNKGLLCERGRFAPLHDRRQRLRAPWVRDGKELKEATWEQANDTVAKALQAASAQLEVVVSGVATNEAASAIVESFPGHKSLAEGAVPARVGAGASMAALDEADLYVVISADLAEHFPVASYAIKRRVNDSGARLIVLSDTETGLDKWAAHRWGLHSAAKAVELAAGAQAPVIIFDAAGAALAAGIATAVPASKSIAFAPAANTWGLIAAGITDAAPLKGASSYYVFAGETHPSADLLKALRRASFVAVQACYAEAWKDVATVLLPTPTNAEKDGTFVNAEGSAHTLSAGVDSNLPTEVAVIEHIAALLR